MLDNIIYGTPDNKPEIAPKGTSQDLNKDTQKVAPEDELKGALQVVLDLHLFMQF